VRKPAFGEFGFKYFWVCETLWSVEEPSSFSLLGMARSGCVSVVLRGCTVSMLSLAHVVVAFRSYQKCQILSANDTLEFPAPTCVALLPLAPIGARIQPLPFAPPSPFGRPALERLAQQAARGTLLSQRNSSAEEVGGGQQANAATPPPTPPRPTPAERGGGAPSTDQASVPIC
jgi:hypothetical protein